MVAEVIAVDAIEDGGGAPGFAELSHQLRDHAVEFALAGVAAVVGVAAVGRVVQFRGGQLLLLDSHPGRLLLGFCAQMGSQGR